ncbi:hypothetical protein Tco_0693954 [Tanacetum coccineum]
MHHPYHVLDRLTGGPAMSLTTLLQEETSVATILSYVPADRLSHRKRLKASPAASLHEATVEAAAEPVTPLVHHRETTKDRLDEQSEMIGGMYEHLLDMPLSRIEETEEELWTLRARMASSEREITSLHTKVRAVELGDESSRVSLGITRTGLAEMRRQVRDIAEQLQQCRIARMYDKERIERIEAYLRRYF